MRLGGTGGGKGSGSVKRWRRQGWWRVQSVKRRLCRMSDLQIDTRCSSSASQQCPGLWHEQWESWQSTRLREEFFVYICLDDWLITGYTASSPADLVHQPIGHPLVLIINTQKSVLVPSQQIQVIGAKLLFKEGNVNPAMDRVTVTTGCAAGLLLNRDCPNQTVHEASRSHTNPDIA